MRILTTSCFVLGYLAIGSLTSAEPKLPPTSAAKPRVLATMERHECYGRCPNYKLTIYADGKVEYLGKHFVKIKGSRTRSLTKTELDQLAKLFATAGFLDLPAKVICGAVDVPYVDTSYDDGKKSNKVTHDPVCVQYGKTATVKADAAKLDALEDAIDALVDIKQWIGKPGSYGP